MGLTVKISAKQLEGILERCEKATASLEEVKKELLQLKQSLSEDGQSEVSSVPRKFTKFDNRRIVGDQIMKKMLETRDKAIDRMRAKQGKK